MDKQNLIMLLGAVKAARAALNSCSGNPVAADIEDRIAVIDEEMRKLARDISKATEV